jgi:hypothetical protein
MWTKAIKVVFVLATEGNKKVTSKETMFHLIERPLTKGVVGSPAIVPTLLFFYEDDMLPFHLIFFDAAYQLF